MYIKEAQLMCVELRFLFYQQADLQCTGVVLSAKDDPCQEPGEKNKKNRC